MNTPPPNSARPIYSIVVITSVRQSLYDLMRSRQPVRGIGLAEVIIVFQEKEGKLQMPLLESLPLNIVFVKRDRGRPYGFYRNEGIRRARGRFILFLDDDVVVLRPDWLTAITEPLASGTAEAVMGRVVVEKSNYLGDTIALLGYPAGGNLGFDNMWHVDRNGYTRHLSTCNAAVLRSALLKIGGFNEGGASGEDNVLAARLTGGGYRILYRDEPVVRHAARTDLSGFMRWHEHRGRSHYFVADTLNEGLYALRLKSYARLMIRELPLRGPLALSLLALSVVCQAWGYFRQARINHRANPPKPLWKPLPPAPGKRAECARVRAGDRFDLMGGLERSLERTSARLTSGPPVISVIIPVKSDYDGITTTLNALLCQDIDEPYEILVSAGMNAVAARAAEKYHPAVRLILGKEDRGPGGNRNRGIEAAKGTYLAFVDADIVPERHWLKSMLAALRRSHGGPVRGWNEIQSRSPWLHLSADMVINGSGKPTRPRFVPGIGGGNMGISRSMLDRYHARFAERIYGAEEIFFLASLPQEKQMVLLDPDIRAKEPRTGGLCKSLRRMFDLGVGSGRLRRNYAMRGAVFAKYPLTVPLMVPARLFQTVCRLRYCRVRDMVIFALMSPVILLHLIWYTAGFSRGARGAEADSALR